MARRARRKGGMPDVRCIKLFPSLMSNVKFSVKSSAKKKNLDATDAWHPFFHPALYATFSGYDWVDWDTSSRTDDGRNIRAHSSSNPIILSLKGLTTDPATPGRRGRRENRATVPKREGCLRVACREQDGDESWRRTNSRDEKTR